MGPSPTATQTSTNRQSAVNARRFSAGRMAIPFLRGTIGGVCPEEFWSEPHAFSCDLSAAVVASSATVWRSRGYETTPAEEVALGKHGCQRQLRNHFDACYHNDYTFSGMDNSPLVGVRVAEFARIQQPIKLHHAGGPVQGGFPVGGEEPILDESRHHGALTRFNIANTSPTASYKI